MADDDDSTTSTAAAPPTLVGPTNYELEPARHPSLRINSQQPFNAEPPGPALVTSYITPAALYYKRNHGPIPVLAAGAAAGASHHHHPQDRDQEWAVEVTGLLPHGPLRLTLGALRAMPAHTVVAALQCAGNRRTEMSRTRKVRGVGWGMAVVGNARWTGVLLSHVLRLAGVDLDSAAASSTAGGSDQHQPQQHVEFVSVDACPEEQGGPYRASLPLAHAADPRHEVLLAYAMNGAPLSRDHGYPLRVVAPGVIGARSVKWVATVAVRHGECQGFFMQRDYKMFSPSVDWDTVRWATRRPIMDFPVQCAICVPVDGAAVRPGQALAVAGYALAGGGRGIERVDVSVDGGRTWAEATRLPQSSGREYSVDDPQRDRWGWVLWEVTFPPVAAGVAALEVVAKAVDSAGNVQVESVDQIWNLRGVLNNSWHRVRLLLDASTPGGAGGDDTAAATVSSSAALLAASSL